MIEVGIVGGGPAGSYCANCLAENDTYPVIFDHTHPREKPCGGLVSPLAQRLFPFLKDIPVECSERNNMYLISPYGNRVCLSARSTSKLRCFSRLKLDQLLIDMAIHKGAELIKEKVVALERKRDVWKVKTARRSYVVKTLIGADGVNSLVRRSIIGPLSKKNKGLCYGYLVTGIENEDLNITFLCYRPGYIWVFPRAGHTSLGIFSTRLSRSHGLKKELDLFIEQHYSHAKKISEWAALIPILTDTKTFRIPVAGPDWMLIGDAAGHVNPVWGEGILYALLDGKLAAQAVTEKDPQLFDRLWRKAYGWSLFRDIKLSKWLYKRPILELYLKFSSLVPL